MFEKCLAVQVSLINSSSNLYSCSIVMRSSTNNGLTYDIFYVEKEENIKNLLEKRITYSDINSLTNEKVYLSKSSKLNRELVLNKFKTDLSVKRTNTISLASVIVLDKRDIPTLPLCCNCSVFKADEFFKEFNIKVNDETHIRNVLKKLGINYLFVEDLSPKIYKKLKDKYYTINNHGSEGIRNNAINYLECVQNENIKFINDAQFIQLFLNKDGIIIDNEQYETLKLMLEGKDSSQRQLAYEIIDRCNFEKSLFYLGLLSENVSKDTIPTFKIYLDNTLNIKSTFVSLFNYSQSNAERIYHVLLDYKEILNESRIELILQLFKNSLIKKLHFTLNEKSLIIDPHFYISLEQSFDNIIKIKPKEIIND